MTDQPELDLAARPTVPIEEPKIGMTVRWTSKSFGNSLEREGEIVAVGGPFGWASARRRLTAVLVETGAYPRLGGRKADVVKMNALEDRSRCLIEVAVGAKRLWFMPRWRHLSVVVDSNTQSAQGDAT